MKTMEIEEAAERLEEVLDIFDAGGEDQIVLTRNGVPAALFLPPKLAETAL